MSNQSKLPRPSNQARPAKAARPRKPRNRKNPSFSENDLGKPVMAPAAMSSEKRTRTATIKQIKGGVRIQHSEFIESINGTDSFQNHVYKLNPGLAETFPWLAPQAVQYEMYEFNDLSVEYISRTASSTAGSVMIAPDYNASDIPPTTERQLSTFKNSVESNAWRNIVCRLDREAMHPLGKSRYVRQGAVSGDLKTYDVGFINVATNDFSSNAIAGKIWVHYDVTLRVPQSSTTASTAPSNTSQAAIDDEFAIAVAGAAEALVWDTVFYDPLAFFSVQGMPGQYIPPRGAYRISFRASFQINTQDEDAVFRAWVSKNGATGTDPNTMVGAANIPYQSASVNEALIFPLNVEDVVECSGTDTVQFMVQQQNGTQATLINGEQTVYCIISPA